jgi:hypothetical protein
MAHSLNIQTIETLVVAKRSKRVGWSNIGWGCSNPGQDLHPHWDWQDPSPKRIRSSIHAIIGDILVLLPFGPHRSTVKKPHCLLNANKNKIIISSACLHPTDLLLVLRCINLLRYVYWSTTGLNGTIKVLKLLITTLPCFLSTLGLKQPFCLGNIRIM